MEACDYEQDVLCDLPTADLNNWVLKRYPSTGDTLSTSEDSRKAQSTSDSIRVSLCDDSDAGCDYYGYAYVEDSEDGEPTGRMKRNDSRCTSMHDDYVLNDAGSIPRVATPIPASTVRHTYLEAVREIIDAESGGESMPPPQSNLHQKRPRLSVLRWASHRKVRTPRPSVASSKRSRHKTPPGKSKWALVYEMLRAFFRPSATRS